MFVICGSPKQNYWTDFIENLHKNALYTRE